MRKKFLAVIFICLFLGASAPLSIGGNKKKIDVSVNTLDNQSKDGMWILGTYGDYTLEPPGEGNHYIYGYTTPYDWDASYFTPSLNLSGLTMVNLTFAYSYSGFLGEAYLCTYSGSMNPNDCEETLIYWDLDGDDGQHGSTVRTEWFDPSTYDHPEEVYIEFYYSGPLYNDIPEFAIDDISIPEIGYYESFEVPYTGSLSGCVTDIFMNPIENVHVNVSFHNTYEEDYTDDIGEYQVTNIPLCWCYKNVTISKDGYKTESVLTPIYENSTYNFILLPKNLVFCANLSPGWNIVSLPFNQSVVTTSFIIKYDGQYYTWNEAVSLGFISDFVFGWNRIWQSYYFCSVFNPGDAYWVYTFEPFELWCYYDPTPPDNYITELQEGWNLISIPFNQTINKTDLLVDDVPWSTAVSNGWISDFLFTWDGNYQIYVYSDDILEPGKGYWSFAYQQCILSKNN